MFKLEQFINFCIDKPFLVPRLKTSNIFACTFIISTFPKILNNYGLKLGLKYHVLSLFCDSDRFPPHLWFCGCHMLQWVDVFYRFITVRY